MKLSMMKDGVEVATGYAGQTIGIAGLFASPAEDGWTQTIPQGSLAPAGVYTLIPTALPEPVEFEPLTPEQQRYLMPRLAPTEFARLLADLETEHWPSGVLPSDVVALIEALPAGRDRELALWDFQRAQYFERVNPLIDQIGAALGLTAAEIDAEWLAFAGAVP